ncbi:hypothetical protein [Bosea minatitlanensis]|uniref:Uncharacterized protein n=1 Tax=Bosea minatitlanensis TaxID=128782 RepID=A0ABW0F673_9HYPH|nr:hypothetical protein [Bosea minatitlanensis]MCT4495578.1 hypothetical protein [Bosea minatitlanensis]
MSKVKATAQRALPGHGIGLLIIDGGPELQFLISLARDAYYSEVVGKSAREQFSAMTEFWANIGAMTAGCSFIPHQEQSASCVSTSPKVQVQALPNRLPASPWRAHPPSSSGG